VPLLVCSNFGGCNRQWLAAALQETAMGPEQLAELRSFFASFEPRLPQVIAAMYSRLLEAAPEVEPLFKGDFQQQQKRYLLMLQELVRLTHSRQLWPVQASTGTSAIPAVDNLGSIHSGAGVTIEHFDKMKTVLAQCLKEISPERFTPAAEEALGFIFDVVANASANARGITAEELARKNKLPHSGEIEEISSDPKTKEQQFWE
jgi:hemoglobin-like flavoprotein